MRIRIVPALLNVLVISVFVVLGSVAAQAAGKTAAPSARTAPSNHVKLATDVHHVIESRFYDPREFSQPRWKIFWSSLDHAAAMPKTDLQFAARFEVAAARLGITHFALYKPWMREGNKQNEKTASSKPSKHVTLTFDKDQVAVLTVHGDFIIRTTAKPLTEAFVTIAKKHPKALIIDLRNDPGGDLSTMILVGHLISKPMVAGLFLGRVWWENHDAVPSRADWKALPHLDKLSLKAFWAALTKTGALVGVVPPMKPYYGGPVYILTNAATASACEPPVYLLQHSGRATVVGRHTAGAMQSSKTVPLPGGWYLQVPVADYYTPQMTRIDEVGITPNVVVPGNQVLAKALALANK